MFPYCEQMSSSITSWFSSVVDVLGRPDYGLLSIEPNLSIRLHNVFTEDLSHFLSVYSRESFLIYHGVNPLSL